MGDTQTLMTAGLDGSWTKHPPKKAYSPGPDVSRRIGWERSRDRASDWNKYGGR